MSQPVITRFNPTVNGLLHLGHLYIALVNECEAHRTPGGCFTVRFDDNQLIWRERLPDRQRAEACVQAQDDLSRYMHVDKWTSQEKDYPYAPIASVDFAGRFGLVVPVNTVKNPLVAWSTDAGLLSYDPDVPDMAFDPTIPAYPYSPWLTAEKVYFDIVDGVTWTIRGVDLVGEYSLYAYFRQIMNGDVIRQTYLPRLMAVEDGQLVPISKTRGGYDIHLATQEMGERGVVELLRASCLKDPAGPFAVENIKIDPRLPDAFS